MKEERMSSLFLHNETIFLIQQYIPKFRDLQIKTNNLPTPQSQDPRFHQPE
jgi:hypothetical protein